MKTLTHTEISKLYYTRLVSLQDTITHIGNSESPSCDIKEILFVYDLPKLRPLNVIDPLEDYIVEDCKNNLIVNAIAYRLGQIDERMATNALILFDQTCDILWDIPTLVSWCKKRKLNIPAQWDMWMKDTYPVLVDRGLLSAHIEHNSPNKRSSIKQETRKAWKEERDDKIRKDAKRHKTANPRLAPKGIASDLAATGKYTMQSGKPLAYTTILRILGE